MDLIYGLTLALVLIMAAPSCALDVEYGVNVQRQDAEDIRISTATLYHALQEELSLFSARIATSRQCPGLGEGNCLISSIDVIPCTIPRRSTTRRPGPNQYGIYSTRYVSEQGGCPVCRILKRNHEIINIAITGKTKNKLLSLSSPGIDLNGPRNYRNSLYVDYNIDCGTGISAYFIITRMDMEGKTCADPNNNDKLKCVDYVWIKQEHGATVVCGNETMSLLIDGSSTIIFRSNRENRFPGFEATVLCFDSKQADLEGCTHTVERRRRGLDKIGNYALSTAEIEVLTELIQHPARMDFAASLHLQEHVEPLPFSFSNRKVSLALQSEMECNPILRAAANAIIEGTSPTRVQALRNPSTSVNGMYHM